MPAKVSFIVRTMPSRAKILKRALDSISAQNTSHEIEVVLVVDGPTPLARNQFSSPRFSLVLHNINKRLGRSAAANIGLKLATGDYVNFLDDDDEILENHISVLTNLLDNSPRSSAAYSAALEVEADIDFDNPSSTVVGSTRVFFTPTESSIELLNRNLFPIQAVMFRRDLLSSGVEMSTKLDALEDWLFWQELLVGRRLSSSSEVTSRFYVPLNPADKKRRIQSHLDAEVHYRDARQYTRVPIQALLETLATGRRETFTAQIARKLKSIAAQRLADASRSNTLVARIERTALTQLQMMWRMRSRPRVSVPAKALPPASANSDTKYLFGTNYAIPKKQKANVVFTSCNLNYFDKALVLAESVKRFLPDFEFHVLLVDIYDDTATYPNVDRVYPVSNLSIFSPSWAFRHNVVEMSTAVKPAYFVNLLDESYDRVYYLDPDTVLYSYPESIDRDLNKRDVLLTPHLHRPAHSDAAISFFEVSSLAHGIYNLGFLAAKNTQKTREIINYWLDRCLFNCFAEVHRGIFTDQKWANNFPVFFPNAVRVSENPGLNTAVWNLENRTMSRTEDGRITVDGTPLELFHFSGWDAGVPRQFSGAGIITDLIEGYERDARRFAQYQKSSWAYGFYYDGSPILRADRVCYRRNADLQAAFPDPYQTTGESFKGWIEAQGRAKISSRYGEDVLVQRVF